MFQLIRIKEQKMILKSVIIKKIINFKMRVRMIKLTESKTKKEMARKTTKEIITRKITKICKEMVRKTRKQIDKMIMKQ